MFRLCPILFDHVSVRGLLGKSILEEFCKISTLSKVVKVIKKGVIFYFKMSKFQKPIIRIYLRHPSFFEISEERPQSLLRELSQHWVRLCLTYLDHFLKVQDPPCLKDNLIK